MTTTSTRVDAISTALDDLSATLTDAPGRHPHDATVAARLARLTWSLIVGQDTTGVLQLLWQAGIQPEEALAIAQAQRGLYLRLAACLGRKRL
jgi:hypothetical protein